VPPLQGIFAGTLIGAGQAHLFESWPHPGLRDDDKRRLLAQAMTLSGNYPGGIKRYIQKARELLIKSKHGVSSFSDMMVEAPEGHNLVPGTQEMLAAEKDGYAHMHTCAFVLVAGGLGERLGYSGIKVALPAEITTGRSFLHYYIENILALESTCDMAPGQHLPLIIMTSEDTHQKTLDLLTRNNYFNAEPSQIILVMQEQVPALRDASGNLATNPDDPFHIMTKPHGHGDVHTLLYSKGLAQKLVEQGYKWIYFFQDTNSLSFKTLPATLGLSTRHDYDVNTMSVPRKSGDACGALLKFRRPDGSVLINNVEYNEVQGLLQSLGLPDHDEATGQSPYPGNTNQILFKLSTYLSCLGESKGAVPEFINPKYSDETKTAFAAPTRLECMMQDLPKLMTDPNVRVGHTMTERWISYSPVKSNLKQGAVLSSSGLPPMTASTGETDLYQANRALLRLSGMTVHDAPTHTFNGIAISPGPRVIFSPSFAVGIGDVIHKVKHGSMSARSTLIVSGPDVCIENLDLDGTLIVRAVKGANVRLQGLVVKNKGWALEPLKGGGSRAPEELRVRGYQLVKYEQRLLEFTEPGDYLCTI